MGTLFQYLYLYLFLYVFLPIDTHIHTFTCTYTHTCHIPTSRGPAPRVVCMCTSMSVYTHMYRYTCVSDVFQILTSRRSAPRALSILGTWPRQRTHACVVPLARRKTIVMAAGRRRAPEAATVLSSGNRMQGDKECVYGAR